MKKRTLKVFGGVFCLVLAMVIFVGGCQKWDSVICAYHPFFVGPLLILGGEFLNDVFHWIDPLLKHIVGSWEEDED